DHVERLAPLRFVDVEDRRTILRADVVALAVERRRVVNAEEHREQLAIADLLRVELDAHRLRMAGVATAHRFVARIAHGAAGVARLDRQNAAHLEECGLQTPEAAAGKYGDLPLLPALSFFVVHGSRPAFTPGMRSSRGPDPRRSSRRSSRH